jgi:mannose/fructose/N-acetylgalactosamine-specific phosphotransferase system component IID
MRRLKKIDLLRIIWRSLYIQGSWNYQRMLNLGFAYSILPILHRLYKDPEKRRLFLKRHLGYFNAHPYFSSYALGAVARLEEKAAVEKWENYDPIQKFKMRLSSPLGAIGDRLFWGMLKPLIATIGVLLTLLYGVVGPIAMFVLYNVPHVYMRYHGVFHGYKMGFDIVRELSIRRYKRHFEWLEKMAVLALGILAGFVLVQPGLINWHFSLIFLVAGATSYLLMRKGFSFFWSLIVVLLVLFLSNLRRSF